MSEIRISDVADADELVEAVIRAGRRDRPRAGGAERALVAVGVAAPLTVVAGVARAGIAKGAQMGAGAAAAGKSALWLVVTQWGAMGALGGAIVLGAAQALAPSQSPHQSVPMGTSIAERERGGTAAHAPQEQHPPSLPFALKEQVEAPGPPASSSVGAVEEAPAKPAEDDSVALNAPKPDESGRSMKATLAPKAPTSSRGAAATPDRAAPPPEFGAESDVPTAPTAMPSATPLVGLVAEVALLDEARAALAGGSPMRALDALDRYREHFPAGHLMVEATAVRIEALAKAGRRRDAAALAKSFLAGFGSTPLAVRVRAVVGMGEGEMGHAPSNEAQ